MNSFQPTTLPVQLSDRPTPPNPVKNVKQVIIIKLGTILKPLEDTRIRRDSSSREGQGHTLGVNVLHAINLMFVYA